jgi:glutathione S-transferase
MKPQVEVIDRAVAGGHLVGNDFTLADIYLMPILFYVPKFPEGAELFRPARNIAAYYERHSARPSFQKTMPPRN